MVCSANIIQYEIAEAGRNDLPPLFRGVTKRTFKSTYQILQEISEVWDDLTDVTQANILNLLAGKRNANAVSALISNFDMAEKALETAATSAGSATKEHEKYMDSINGKINQFRASFEALSSTVVESDFVKGLVDGATSLVSLLDDITSAFTPIPGVIMGIMSIAQVSGFGRQKMICLLNMPKYTLTATLNELAA